VKLSYVNIQSGSRLTALSPFLLLVKSFDIAKMQSNYANLFHLLIEKSLVDVWWQERETLQNMARLH